MRVSAARPEAVQVVAVRRWPLGCVMRKRRVSVRLYCTRYISTHHTQGPRNRHGWIDQATCLLLRCCRAQAFVRVNQQVSSSVLYFGFLSFFQKQRDVLLTTRFSKMGRGIICGQPGLCWDHRQGRHLHFQSIRFVSRPFVIRNFYIYQRRQQDVLSVFDENDPTAARPTTREKARELCSEHMAEWASSNSNSGDLTKLRIGIPQVCPLAVTSPVFDFNNYGLWV